jgi:hypothetical protein
MTDKQYKVALSKIVNYLTTRGYTVNLKSNTFGFFFEEDLIVCPAQSKGLSMLSGLLHEAGHAVQSDSVFAGLRKTNKRNKAIIAELEYTAWFHGWSIAEELDICTNELWLYYRQQWLTYWSEYIERVYEKPTDKLYIDSIADSYAARKPRELNHPRKN